MSNSDEFLLQEMEQAVKAHREKIDRAIERSIEKGLASGKITHAHLEKASNGDTWFRLIDQEGVPIVYNYSSKTMHSYGGALNQDKATGQS